MFSKKLIKRLSVFASTALFSLSTMQSAYAAPGTLATAPLFLSSIVEPNVFYTLDDSGSMDWELMVGTGTAGFATSGGLPYVDGLRRGYYSPTFSRLYTSRHVLPPAYLIENGNLDDPLNPPTHPTAWDDAWVFFTIDGNRSYYDPTVTYTPWPGSKADGSPMYADADPTAALKDPNLPGGEKINLTAYHTFSEGGNTTNFMYLPVYFTWTDDGDGVLETTDTHSAVFISAGTPEMQNFANWFQYYRSRVNATKSIIGTTINNTDASRMGMRFFNNGHRKDSLTMSDVDNKRELLEELYDLVIPQAGTPMRRALRDTGNYFDNTGSSAPILSAALGGECQQNFNILMGDGFWNGGDPGVGNTDSNGGSYSTPYDGNASQSNDGGNYADSYSNTLADVAMRDYERDLRTDLANNVPTTAGIDEADHQHLVTYSIAFGITGSLDPTVDDPLAVGFAWPQPNNDPRKVDDMWHAAYNGRGQFLSAQDPDELELALSTAIADIAERTATAAAVALNSTKLTTDSVVYLAQFNTNRWQGDLFAFKIIDLNLGTLASTPEWSASTELTNRNLTTNPRTIITYNGSDGIPFRWANLNTAQKDDLRTSPSGGTDSDAVASARVDYLRGSRVDEGTGNFFRERLSLLGDIVNSGPVFVGAPDLNWPDQAPFPTLPGTRYSDFKASNVSLRDGIVYAGANDGFLHGYAEADGEERLAYIPNVFFSTNSGEGLHYLTDQNYGHRYYVDLTPTVSDIYTNLGTSTKWSTVLIGGLRGGGRGIFALDITDPSTFTESNAADISLWEFTNSDDPDLGFTYSRPQIAMGNDGNWYAIFGNGYNDTGDGEAKLFIVDIAKGVDGWAAGDYIEISTNSGTPADRNGLATPALADLDGNGTIDRVYAGDLRGQMWVFDMSSNSSSSWGIPSTDPLFTTIGNEPITAQPTLSKHPTVSDTGSNSPNVMVFFGSGQYLVNADKSSTDLNHFYGVWDKGDDDLDETDLVQQTYDTSFTTGRVLSNNAVDYTGTDYGWYFELPDTGERSVTRPVVRGSVVFFNTFVPNSDPCSVGGYGYRFAVDLTTGGSPDEVVVDSDGDGILDDNDKVTNSSGGTGVLASTGAIPGYQPESVFGGNIRFTGDETDVVEELKNIPTGRFSWQELIQ